jgi:uncharacterized protein (TIGR00255 family)
MTGYGKATAELPGCKITVEIKSLNSKQADLALRLPYAFSEKELEIRALLSRELERGKISVYINRENLGSLSNSKINTELAKNYYQQLQALKDELGDESATDLMALVMRMPEVVSQTNDDLNEEEELALMQTLKQAIAFTDAYRLQEGEILKADFALRVGIILDLLKQVDQYEESRIQKVKSRLYGTLMNQIDELKIDKNRFEQELIFYLEKFDVTEEKVRLKQNCDYFIQSINDKEASNGKKLGFILQEIGREINTLGSKSNDSDMQRLVVQMKDELEKMKEQSLNIL